MTLHSLKFPNVLCVVWLTSTKETEWCWELKMTSVKKLKMEMKKDNLLSYQTHKSSFDRLNSAIFTFFWPMLIHHFVVCSFILYGHHSINRVCSILLVLLEKLVPHYDFGRYPSNQYFRHTEIEPHVWNLTKPTYLFNTCWFVFRFWLRTCLPVFLSLATILNISDQRRRRPS